MFFIHEVKHCMLIQRAILIVIRDNTVKDFQMQSCGIIQEVLQNPRKAI